MTQEQSSNGAVQQGGLPTFVVKRQERDTLAFFQQVPLFRGLPEDQLNQLASAAETLHFKRDDVIIQQGAPNNHIYFIRDGIVGVTVHDPETGQDTVVSYFHQNHIFGEFGLFSSEQHIATANVTALSEVNLARMRHADFTETLNDYHPAAMEVARILTQRLQAPTDKILPLPQENNIYLVMGLNKGVGATTVGSSLSAALAKSENSSVVYTEYPEGNTLPETFGYASTEFYDHPEGYDIFVPRGMPRLVPAVHLNLIFERLQRQYNTIVITIPSKLIHEIADLLEHISRVILVASPARWEQLMDLSDLLHASAYVNEDTVIHVANYCYPEYASYPVPDSADFDIPFLVAMDLAEQKTEGIPEKLFRVASDLGGRLEGENEFKVYIPLVTILPSGDEINNSPAVEKLMWIMRDAFDDVSLDKIEGEANIVTSKASVEDVNAKWQHVLKQVFQLKSAIRQDKLAMAINDNLVVV